MRQTLTAFNLVLLATLALLPHSKVTGSSLYVLLESSWFLVPWFPHNSKTCSMGELEKLNWSLVCEWYNFINLHIKRSVSDGCLAQV